MDQDTMILFRKGIENYIKMYNLSHLEMVLIKDMWEYIIEYIKMEEKE